jgi:hypothetical protein
LEILRVLWAGGQPWPIAVYLVGMALVTLVSVYCATETLHVDLTADDVPAS